MRRRGGRGYWLAVLLAIAVPGQSVHALPQTERATNAKRHGEGRPGEPGSGVPLESEGRPNTDLLRAPLPLRPRNQREVDALGELETLSARYRDAHRAFAHSVAHVLVTSADAGRRALEDHYRRRIREHEGEARRLRAQAIERYLAFLQLHPAHPTWTPEIMFRVAELHFEAADERYLRQQEAYETALEAHQARGEDEAGAPPTAPQADYGEAIGMYRDVVVRFPNYSFDDAALYMMGTLLGEEEKLDESRQAYLALVCHETYPPPAADGSNLVPTERFRRDDYRACKPLRAKGRFNDEAWLRIGELHYDLDELDPALEAYVQATRDPHGEVYDEALIRMAWTLYLKRDFAAAAARFDEFIRYADPRLAQGDTDGALALRDDAVRYLAKAYVEEDWDGDQAADAEQGFARLDRDYRDRGQEPHVPEVYAALGDLLAEQTEYGQAIAIWQETLRRWPLARAAPQIQLRILQAHGLLQDPDGATQARDALATHYLRDTPWYRAHQDDPEAIEAAQKLAEDALVATALDHHQRAQELRALDDASATAEYAIAAKAYEAYLERFPNTPSSYEYRFNFAESLFYSGQLLKAGDVYSEVRDSNLDNRLQADAALGAVSAYAGFVSEQRKAGRMQVPEMPKQGDPGPFDAQPLPPVMVKLQAAYDRYADVIPDGEQTGTMKYLAGEVSQRYAHFDDAERRFVHVLERHCAENVAINAGKAIIDGHVARGDLEATRTWTERLMSMSCGSGDASSKFAGELKTLKNAVRFQEATLLYEAAEYEAAADRYVALVDAAPSDPNADRALNNAAVSYEKIGRFGSASKTYERIYSNYPDSEFADDALLRSGFNHVRFFEFEEAVKAYLVLAEDKRYDDSEFRELSLWNAADLLDNLQEYPRAAALFRQYASKAEDPEKAAEASFRAAQALAKTGDLRATVAAFQAFVTRHGSDPNQVTRTLEAQLHIGRAFETMGRRKQAEEGYRATVELFAARGLQPATEAADFPAQAQFRIAQYAMADTQKVELRGTGKALERETKALLDNMVRAAEAYAKVVAYRRTDWALAAVYRTGYAFETTALKLREAPVPRQLAQYSDGWFAYKDIVEQAAMQFEAKAVAFYEQTLTRAKEFGMANEWTNAARERLNVYKPEEYPLLHRPALDLQLEDRR